MGERNIKKEVKKPKKTDKKAGTSVASSAVKPMATQPELIKKVKKVK